MKKTRKKENSAGTKRPGAKKNARHGERKTIGSSRSSSVDIGRAIERYGAVEVMPTLDEATPETVKRTSPGKKRAPKKAKKELNIFGEAEERISDFEEKEEAKEPMHKRAVIGLAILAFVVIFVGALVALNEMLIVQTIEVSGNVNLERAEILTTSGINVGEHMWLINLRGTKEALQADPHIKSAAIKRVYPDTLRIAIVERVPLAAIVGAASTTLIDKEGYVLDIEGKGEALDLIQIYGMGALAYSVGRKIDTEDEFNSATLLTILSALESEGLLENIKSMDVSQPLSILLYTHSGYCVHLGQPEDVGGKLKNLSKVLQTADSLGLAGGTIDVAVLGDPVYSPPENLVPETSSDLAATPSNLPGETPNQEATPGDLNAQGTPAPVTSTGEETSGFSG